MTDALVLMFDPWRGGYEIALDGTSLLLVNAQGHGGGRLLGIDDPQALPEGRHALPLQTPALRISAADGMLLLEGSSGQQLRLRLGTTPSVVEVRHEDFKG